jgi:hypothetical protein
MTAKDRFEIAVACLRCQNSGIAQLSQEAARSSFSNGDTGMHIRSLPIGFEGRYGTRTNDLSICCTTCNVVVWPMPK